MKYALIIGNNEYGDPKLSQLKTPAADSQALAKVLEDESIGDFDEVISLVNKIESEIRRAISSFFSNKKPDDLILLYFSGHGVLDERGRLYLALKDTQTSLLKATAIPASFISDEMDSCRSKRQILILDCCNSGAFARGTKGTQRAVSEVTFEGNGFGRVVLTASDSTQYALEGDQVLPTDLSLFTYFLLKGLKTGKADTDNDGYISLDEWYEYTYTQVLSTTPNQVPHKWSYNQQGDLLVAKNPFAKKKTVELPLALSNLLESPYPGVREAAIKELGKLLHSQDRELAELAFRTLERLSNDDSRTVSLAAKSLLSDSLVPPIPDTSFKPTPVDSQKYTPTYKPQDQISPSSFKPHPGVPEDQIGSIRKLQPTSQPKTKRSFTGSTVVFVLISIGMIGIIFLVIAYSTYQLFFNRPLATPTNDPFTGNTEIAQTVEAVLTLTAFFDIPSTTSPATQSAPETATPLPPSNTPIPSTSTPPPPTSTPICDNATFVTDVTIPDGTPLLSRQTYVKIWRIRNNGECTWTTNYSLVFVSGNIMGGASHYQLSSSVAPGQTLDISINLIAPSAVGNYVGNWQLANEAGVRFDNKFFVNIVVKGTPTPTPSITPFALPTRTATP